MGRHRYKRAAMAVGTRVRDDRRGSDRRPGDDVGTIVDSTDQRQRGRTTIYLVRWDAHDDEEWVKLYDVLPVHTLDEQIGDET